MSDTLYVGRCQQFLTSERGGAAMKAIVQRGYGSDAVLTFDDVDIPAVREGDVLVRVRAASVNAADWYTMIGTPYLIRAISGLRSPRVPVAGKALAGEVVAVG